jgi:hypothetical protein
MILLSWDVDHGCPAPHRAVWITHYLHKARKPSVSGCRYYITAGSGSPSRTFISDERGQELIENPPKRKRRTDNLFRGTNDA